jgi:hypothetical protein
MALGVALTFFALSTAKYIVGLYQHLYSSYTWGHLANLIIKDFSLFLLMVAVSDISPVGDEYGDNKAFMIAKSVPLIMTAYAFFELTYSLGFSVRQVERDVAV